MNVTGPINLENPSAVTIGVPAQTIVDLIGSKSELVGICHIADVENSGRFATKFGFRY
jgi:hypothetical protein